MATSFCAERGAERERKMSNTTFRGKTVRQVYFGKVGCACGCRGNYHETPAMISRAVKKIETAEAIETTETSEGLIAWAYFGERTVAVYCNP